MKIQKLKEKNLLHLHNIRKIYPNGEKDHVVLRDIDLSVEKGEFCTVVGPSGCGKSTLLRLVLGQEKATSGELTLDNREIGIPCKRRGIVYQNYSLFPHKTVLENVMSYYNFNSSFYDFIKSPKKYILDKKKAKEEAMHYIEKVRLNGSENKYPDELSGGMKQRASIAQSLIAKPEILLMDEPFSALDPGTREDLQLFTKEIWEENNMTIFFVSHDLEEAVFLGTRLIVLSQHYKNSDGALIVKDHDVSNYIDKSTSEFGKLMESIKEEGFSKEYIQHIKEFKLNHKDSFRD